MGERKIGNGFEVVHREDFSKSSRESKNLTERFFKAMKGGFER